MDADVTYQARNFRCKRSSSYLLLPLSHQTVRILVTEVKHTKSKLRRLKNSRRSQRLGKSDLIY